MSVADPDDFGFEKKVPDGDSLERDVCSDCGWVHYVNPKIVVGAVVTYGDKFLLCKRAIEPRNGYWTLPAGYMEEKETTEQGAMREALEEANADITLTGMLALYNIPHISQVQIMYRAHLEAPEFSAGVESEDVRLFTWDEIPWSDLAFPTVYWALHQYRQIADETTFLPFGNATDEMLKTSFDILKR